MKRKIILTAAATSLVTSIAVAAIMSSYEVFVGPATIQDFIQVWEENSDKGARRLPFSTLATDFLNGQGGWSTESDPVYLAWDKDYLDMTNRPANMTDAQVVAGLDTTPMFVSAAQLKLAIDTHAPDTFVLPTGTIGDFLQYDTTSSVTTYTPVTAQEGAGIDITDGVISVVVDSSAFSGNLGVTDDTLDEVATAFDEYSVSYVPPVLDTVVANATNYVFSYDATVTAGSTADLCADFVLEWDTAGTVTFAYGSGNNTDTVTCTGTAVAAGDTVVDGLDYNSATGTIVNAQGIPLGSMLSKAVTNATSGSEPSDDFTTDTIANYDQVGVVDGDINTTTELFESTSTYSYSFIANKTAVSSNNMTMTTMGDFNGGRMLAGMRLTVNDTLGTASGYVIGLDTSALKVYDCTTSVELNYSNCTALPTLQSFSTLTANTDYEMEASMSGTSLTVKVRPWTSGDTESWTTRLNAVTLPTVHSGNKVAVGIYSHTPVTDNTVKEYSVTTP